MIMAWSTLRYKRLKLKTEVHISATVITEKPAEESETSCRWWHFTKYSNRGQVLKLFTTCFTEHFFLFYQKKCILTLNFVPFFTGRKFHVQIHFYDCGKAYIFWVKKCNYWRMMNYKWHQSNCNMVSFKLQLSVVST